MHPHNISPRIFPYCRHISTEKGYLRSIGVAPVAASPVLLPENAAGLKLVVISEARVIAVSAIVKHTHVCIVCSTSNGMENGACNSNAPALICGLYRGYVGLTEQKMETTIYLEYIGYRVEPILGKEGIVVKIGGSNFPEMPTVPQGPPLTTINQGPNNHKPRTLKPKP